MKSFFKVKYLSLSYVLSTNIAICAMVVFTIITTLFS